MKNQPQKLADKYCAYCGTRITGSHTIDIVRPHGYRRDITYILHLGCLNEFQNRDAELTQFENVEPIRKVSVC